jgi:hypothetical protein
MKDHRHIIGSLDATSVISWFAASQIRQSSEFFTHHLKNLVA